MGAEHDRDLEVVADAASDLDDALLMRRIERDQRLVEQEQPRPAEQRLAQQHPLALAAGKFADRAAGEVARAHFVERPVDLASRRLIELNEAEARAHRGAGDDVPAGEPKAPDRGAVLRHVADRGIASRRRLAEHADLARGDRDEPERGAHQRGLAGAVGAQHADEFAVLDRRSSPPRGCPGGRALSSRCRSGARSLRRAGERLIEGVQLPHHPGLIGRVRRLGLGHPDHRDAVSLG